MLVENSEDDNAKLSMDSTRREDKSDLKQELAYATYENLSSLSGKSSRLSSEWLPNFNPALHFEVGQSLTG